MSSRARQLVFALIAIIIASALWATFRARRAFHQSDCTSNLHAIAHGLFLYREHNGSLPPAITYDAAGKPMQSWRMLIARLLMPDEFSEYKLDEPWDSATNLRFVNKVPHFFRCPNDSADHTESHTSYVMFMHDLEGKNASRAVLVAEMADSGILWTEPRDILTGELDSRVNDFSADSIRSHDKDGPGVIFVIPKSDVSRNTLIGRLSD